MKIGLPTRDTWVTSSIDFPGERRENYDLKGRDISRKESRPRRNTKITKMQHTIQGPISGNMGIWTGLRKHKKHGSSWIMNISRRTVSKRKNNVPIIGSSNGGRFEEVKVRVYSCKPKISNLGVGLTSDSILFNSSLILLSSSDILDSLKKTQWSNMDQLIGNRKLYWRREEFIENNIFGQKSIKIKKEQLKFF